MQSREDAPRSRRLASPRGGRRPKRISKPSVSAFFTGPEELKDAAHSAALLAQLKSFYDARLLCDVTIEVVTPGSGPGTGRLFSCNRNVLAAACPYFKSMFTGGMYESQQASVTIHDVDAESFEVLVDYCYTVRAWALTTWRVPWTGQQAGGDPVCPWPARSSWRRLQPSSLPRSSQWAKTTMHPHPATCPGLGTCKLMSRHSAQGHHPGRGTRLDFAGQDCVSCGGAVAGGCSERAGSQCCGSL